jgi:DNA invertase Pin-like site-specific DNA recombinase
MPGQRVGYVRVSTADQNTQRQLDGHQLDRLFTDRLSGKDTARPQLEAMLRYLREGDTLLVHSMDRLACNLDDLRRLVRELTGRGVRVSFVKEGLTFTGEDSPMATLLLSVMEAFAERTRPDPRTATRGHRPGQGPRCLPRPTPSTQPQPGPGAQTASRRR